MSTQQPYLSIDYLQSFRAGHECGFDYYFKKWFRPLCFYAGRYIKEEQDTEDIVSEAFIRVWQKRSIFSQESGLRNYLYTTVRNTCLKRLQYQKKAEEFSREQAFTAEKEEKCFFKNMLHTEFLRELYEAFNHLPPACRRVLTKLYIEGKTITEIAVELNQATSTIATHRKYGLKILRKHVAVIPKRSFGSL